MLTAKVTRGKYKGKLLYPHKGKKDSKYVASLTRFEEDYVRTDSLDELAALVKAGYGARMSNDEIPNAPSFITHSKILVSEELTLEPTEFLSNSVEERNLDGDSIAKVRKEQSFLRAHLLRGRQTAECTLCGETFPFDFLVAAHIKKRSACTTDEKLDFDNVAALMCKAGCDDLFEKGYVAVVDGIIVQARSKQITNKLNELINQLTGKAVQNWAGSELYYRWHQKAHVKS